VTYSIVARDADSGQIGVAVASHVLGVGAAVPWAEPGVGVVATQAFLEISYGPRMLAALRSGQPAGPSLADLVGADPMASTRQVAVIGSDGTSASHQGASCIIETGLVTGDGYSTQANMMLNPGVPETMAAAFVSADGTLAVRLLAALDAAEELGGDIRGRQSAALKVMAGVLPAFNGGWLIDLRVDDHTDPLMELRRLVELHASRNPSQPDGPARAASLGRGNPEGWFWMGIELANQGKLAEARRALGHAFAVSDNWRELLRRLPRPGLLAIDESALAQLLD